MNLYSEVTSPAAQMCGDVGLHMGVGLQPPAVVAVDAGGVQIQAADIAFAPGGDQDGVARRSPRRTAQGQDSSPPRRVDLRRRARSVTIRMPSAIQLLLQHLGGVVHRRGRECAAPLCRIVTCAPKRAKTWPSSQPMGPPPRTTMRCGRVVQSKTVRLVS